jgi:hypothetical protein
LDLENIGFRIFLFEFFVGLRSIPKTRFSTPTEYLCAMLFQVTIEGDNNFWVNFLQSLHCHGVMMKTVKDSTILNENSVKIKRLFGSLRFSEKHSLTKFTTLIKSRKFISEPFLIKFREISVFILHHQ